MLLTRVGASSATLAQLIHSATPIATNRANRCLILLVQPQLYESTRILSTKSKFQNAPCQYISNKAVSTSTKATQIALPVTKAFNLLGNVTAAKKTTVKELPPNIRFRYCPTKLHDGSISKTRPISYDLASHSAAGVAPRPLLILFGWMQSIESHLEKYREFWFNRGYDVLSVRTLPPHLLMPRIGGKRNAEIMYSFISEFRPRYDEILVHAFSVGGYQLGEFLNILTNECEKGNKNAEQLYSAIKGFIVDSCVFADDCPPGLSRAITTNPVIQPILESSIRNFLKLTKPLVLDRYNQVASVIIGNKRCIPGLMLYSKDDIVSHVPSNKAVSDGWAERGGISKWKCWETSGHVLHYKNHTEEYTREVDEFVKLCNITKAKPQFLNNL